MQSKMMTPVMKPAINAQEETDMSHDRQERRKAYCKAYREKNKERQKAWYEANKTRIRKAERELRAFLRQEQESE